MFRRKLRELFNVHAQFGFAPYSVGSSLNKKISSVIYELFDTTIARNASFVQNSSNLLHFIWLKVNCACSRGGKWDWGGGLWLGAIGRWVGVRKGA